MSDSYLPGAVVLANSLRDAGTTKKLAVLGVIAVLLARTVEIVTDVAATTYIDADVTVITTAIDPTRPSWRTFRYVASSQTYGYDPTSGRARNRSTSSSSV